MTPVAQALRLKDLCQLYSLIDLLQVRFDIRNKVMDRIQDGFAVIDKFPEPQLIAAIYQHTSAVCPLRKFCAESILYSIYLETYIPSKEIPELMKTNDFANDFIEAIRRLSDPGKCAPESVDYSSTPLNLEQC